MSFNRLQSSTSSNSSRFLNNNNNIEAEKCCSSSSQEKLSGGDEQPNNANNVASIEEAAIDSENENPEISEDEEFINYEDDDEQLSSPSNSDVDDQRWYAFRGRWMISNMNNQPPLLPLLDNQQQRAAPQPQDEEETDFLEMDFEPDTNSEIENEAKGAADYPPILNNGHANDFPPQLVVFPPPNSLQPMSNGANDMILNGHQSSNSRPSNHTGAKPKQRSSNATNQQQQHIPNHQKTFFEFRQHEPATMASAGSASSFISDHNKHSPLSSPQSKVPSSSSDDYNMGASCSYHDQTNGTASRTRKSPSKSFIHRQKQERLDEERRNDNFLFEIEPMKPKNSVTIYTMNCDEKICMDTLTSLNINTEKYRDLITSYFDRSSVSSERDLVGYLIARSKMNCNYMKLRELFERICSLSEIDNDEIKFDINFYPLDMFSSTPEMIDVEVSELVQRWKPQTDLRPLVNIRNKYFYQTNVLGKVVSIIRRINQKPSSPFKENETIRIPQFYTSGYITITITPKKTHQNI